MFKNLTFTFFIILLLLISCQEPISPVWETVPPPTDQKLHRVTFLNENEGIIVGGERFVQDLIFKTSDGGNTWERRLPSTEFGKIIFDVAFIDELQGWAAGFESKMLKTVDGGENWDLVQLGLWRPMHALDIVNDSLIVAVGGVGYDDGIIYRSADFGKNWSLVDTLPYEFRDVKFTDANTGYACGYGLILKTTDAGKTWDFTPAKGEFFSAMSFPTTQIGYVVGRTGTILKTTDAGESWKRLRDGNNPILNREYYNQVVFLDTETGYIIGDNGIILKTTDGGSKWIKFDRETKANLYGIHLFSEGSGIIVGENGTILRFEE